MSRAILRLFVTSVLFVAVTAALPAQQLRKNGNPAPAPFGPPHVDVIGATSITQSTNPTTVTTGNSVSCNAGSPTFLHTDNSYYRAFTLSAFNPPLDQLQFMVQSVTIGIEQSNAAGTGTTQPVTINIYNAATNPPTLATLGPVLSTVTANVSDQALTTLTIPLTTQPVLITATSILVVEVFTPSGQVAGHSFFIGSNALGQSGPSYIRAPSCGINEITNLASIGFANMHIVMVVNGNSQAPVSLETVTVD
jgi:hypothetical protein